MISPVKAIIAGALVFAIGGVMLIAQPFDQQGGSMPGAAQPAEGLEPSFFTGTAGDDWRNLSESSETRPDGVVVGTGSSSVTWKSNDPRINGQATFVGTEMDYREGALADSPTGHDGALRKNLTRVVNNDGAWEGTLDFIQIDDVGLDIAAGWLVGEDAYEGLMAYVVVDYAVDVSLSGHITPEGPPPVPDTLLEQ